MPDESRSARLGNSAIRLRRCASLSRDQAVISSIVRKQPLHSRDAGSITQILIQGLSIVSVRFFDLLLI